MYEIHPSGLMKLYVSRLSLSQTPLSKVPLYIADFWFASRKIRKMLQDYQIGFLYRCPQSGHQRKLTYLAAHPYQDPRGLAK